MHPSRPNVLFMQKHWDVMRSDDAGDIWHEVSGNLPTDFGFVIDVHAHEPETIYVVPIKSDSEHFPLEGKLRVYRSRSGGNEWEPLTNGLPQANCYVNVLRDAMAVDTLDRLRRVLRHHGRPGVCVERRRRQLERPSSAIFPPCCRWRCRRCHDPRRPARRICACMANVDGEVTLDGRGRGDAAVRCSTRSRRSYPVLRGTIRDHGTQRRRPFLRFFACQRGPLATNRRTRRCPRRS